MSFIVFKWNAPGKLTPVEGQPSLTESKIKYHNIYTFNWQGVLYRVQGKDELKKRGVSLEMKTLPIWCLPCGSMEMLSLMVL